MTALSNRTLAVAGLRAWVPKITATAPMAAGDPRLPVLAARLANLNTARGDAHALLRAAANQGTLPDDHPADALGYRITALVEQRNNQQRRETIRSPLGPPHPEDHRPHHDYGRGISI